MGLWVFYGPWIPWKARKDHGKEIQSPDHPRTLPQNTDTGTHCGRCRAVRGKQEDMGDMPSHQEFQQLPPTLGKQARSGTLG